MDFWDSIYNFFGIKDFIYFISSSQLQDMLFPIKLVFVSFAMFFLAFVIYFMLNSSWLQYKFLEDVTEFFSWKALGAREITKQWNRIRRRTASGLEADYKLAIIDAEDFFNETMERAGYEGDNFEEALEKAGELLDSSSRDLLQAHQTRNSIVYDPNFELSDEEANRVLAIYEAAINTVGLS